MHMLPRLEDTFWRALAMGIPIVTGADSSYGPESIARISMEMANFVELGMTPLQALQSATSTAAELLEIDDRTGRIEVGLEADVIVIDGNPLEDIRFAQDVIVVISNGRVGLNRLPFRKGP